MPKTGKITKVTSKPSRSFILTVPADPGPPPVPETDYIYVGVDADDWALAIAARTSGKDATVDGTPPSCSGVSV